MAFRNVASPSPFTRSTIPDLALEAVLDGLGLAQLAAYQVCDLLRDQRLVGCLDQHAPDDGGHYLCYLSRKLLPARIRVFVDYMTEHTRLLDLECSTPLAMAQTHERQPA